MNKKLKFHIWSQWGVLGLVMLLAVGIVAVKAYTNYGLSQPASVIENAENVTINQAIPEAPAQEAPLGAISDATNLPAMMCSSDFCVYTAAGSFRDATTTILSFADPFKMATTSPLQVVLAGTTNDFGYGYTGATSTVDLVALNITTAATSTYAIACGAATGPNTAATNELLTTGSQAVATGTTGMIVNNFDGDSVGVTGGSAAKVMLTPNYPYFNCIVTTTGYDSTFTSGANTFDGKFSVRISRPR